MIFVSVEVDCDVCLDRIVEGATSVPEARRVARRRGAKATRGEHGSLVHTCKRCLDCARLGHRMEAVTEGFAKCSLCGMCRSIADGRSVYRTPHSARSDDVPPCPKREDARRAVKGGDQ